LKRKTFAQHSTLFLDPDAFPDSTTPSRTLRFSKTWQCVWHECIVTLCTLVGTRRWTAKLHSTGRKYRASFGQTCWLASTGFGRCHLDALFQDLLLSTTLTLEHLSIADFYFNETSFPPLIKALQSNTTDIVQWLTQSPSRHVARHVYSPRRQLQRQ
jgi:hypothetical protein